MSYELTAEQIQSNWEGFLDSIGKYISPERGDKLLDMYKRMEDFVVLAPAAISKSNHNCIPGGYIDHINRVLNVAFKIKAVWESEGSHIDFTDEELAFVCINHDLGKLGLPGTPGATENDNDWEVNKLGKIYKINTALPFATVPDRGLFILQSEGISVSYNEYLGIKLHDGLYDESNKPYLISYQVESRLRTNLPYIVHQADLLSARVEWEREWLPKLGKPSAPRPASKPTGQKASQAALKKLGSSNPGIMNALKNI